MDEGRLIAHNRDVPLPEQQVTALQLVEHAAGQRNRLAERLLLHVAVARAGDPAGRESYLHQPGTVHAEVGLAAPQVRSAEEALRDCNKIGLGCIQGCKMPRGGVTA